MKLNEALREWRNDLLNVEIIMHENGKLAALRVKVGVPLAVGMILIAVVRVGLLKLWP